MDSKEMFERLLSTLKVVEYRPEKIEVSAPMREWKVTPLPMKGMVVSEELLLRMGLRPEDFPVDEEGLGRYVKFD